MPSGADPHPRTAVIVPCHDDGPLLVEALGSLQGGEPFEVVVVDDHSGSDETREVLAGLEARGTRIIRHPSNRGLSEARNTGLRSSVARYVFPLDSDDLAVPEALSRMADLLDADPGAAVCFGDYVEFGDSNLVRVVPGEIDPFRLAYANEYPVAALLRRSALEDVGGWRTIGAGYEDWDLWLALAERGARGIHAGADVVTFRKRIQSGRMLAAAKREHRALYRELRRGHARLFADLPRHRRASRLSRSRKLLYPVVYGGRRRFAVEQRLKRLLDRLGIWTLRRRMPEGPDGPAEGASGRRAP
jgi:glycosyltransferase involved in cell wall biosynthesis